MEATRIIAIRHGETAWNVGGRVQGHLDIGLNDKGRWQAQQAAQALAGEPIQALYASDLWRTYAEIATAKGFQQRILRVEHAVTGGEGARASIRLADPAMVAGLLGG